MIASKGVSERWQKIGELRVGYVLLRMRIGE